MTDSRNIDYTVLRFPVIWVGEKGAQAFIDLEHLRTCSDGPLKGGFRKRGAIVDAALVSRTVTEVRVVGFVPPFRGYRLPGTRILLLDYDFDEAGRPVSLEELKRMIVAAERRCGYEAMADEPGNYEASIHRLASFEEIVRMYQIGPKRGWLRKFWAGPLD